MKPNNLFFLAVTNYDTFEWDGYRFPTCILHVKGIKIRNTERRHVCGGIFAFQWNTNKRIIDTRFIDFFKEEKVTIMSPTPIRQSALQNWLFPLLFKFEPFPKFHVLYMRIFWVHMCKGIVQIGVLWPSCNSPTFFPALERVLRMRW